MEPAPAILYEDSVVVVVNKPTGLIVHSDGRTEEPSLSEWLVGRYPELKGVGEPWRSPQGETIDRPGIVHRLDRTTSGVMIVAKTQEAYEFLKREFQERRAQKEYRAYVYGHFKESHGVIEKEIIRIRAQPPRWGVVKGEDMAVSKNKPGRAAITAWEVLARGTDSETGEAVSFIAARPKTGRTHQIRVHLQAIHHPVVADPLYAKGKPKVLGFGRPALHAFSLALTLPGGVAMKFEAPLPDDFLNAEKRFLPS